MIRKQGTSTRYERYIYALQKLPKIYDTNRSVYGFYSRNKKRIIRRIVNGNVIILLKENSHSRRVAPTKYSIMPTMAAKLAAVALFPEHSVLDWHTGIEDVRNHLGQQGNCYTPSCPVATKTILDAISQQ